MSRLVVTVLSLVIIYVGKACAKQTVHTLTVSTHTMSSKQFLHFDICNL